MFDNERIKEYINLTRDINNDEQQEIKDVYSKFNELRGDVFEFYKNDIEDLQDALNNKGRAFIENNNFVHCYFDFNTLVNFGYIGFVG